MDLSATIAGVKFPTCFMNASGALCVTREELLALGRSRAGAIVTKSMTLEPRLEIPNRVIMASRAAPSTRWGFRISGTGPMRN